MEKLLIFILLFFSARRDETKFKPTSGCQPNWQLSIATSQWWQQCQKGGSAERTTAKRRPLHASGGAAAIPLPAGPQSVTETWAAPSAILYAPWGWSRASPRHSTGSKPQQRTTSDRSAAAERQRDCNRQGTVGALDDGVLVHGGKGMTKAVHEHTLYDKTPQIASGELTSAILV